MLVEPGDIIPSDGEVIEGVASVDESAITGESAPVIRESGGDRSAVTGGTRVLSDWIEVKITATQRLDLPRPHDRAGGRRGAPEDPQRDRAQYPAGGPDHHLRLCGGDHSQLCGLCQWHHLGAGAGGAVRHPDPHHHRRAAVRHRHRRHGPAGALQCAGDVGPRGGSGGRCGHAAAGQDRHHHPGQPPGHGVPAAGQASANRNWRKPPVFFARRRDAGRPLHRRAGQEKYGIARWQAPRAHFVPFTAQTRLSGIDLDGSIRKGAVDAVLAWAGPRRSAGARR